ncbi:kinesin-like protein KIF2C isoform X2 [Pimephales promelas]|uniref:kinesin-like protein KIF2C isoform X2 n=1 Tax=Pimephales promelas TaxID=90988 RepID=UPI001955BA14|nr:kinesin-like protein KIF2C isoform X2 [Pimephales promelas]KAG1934735.1 kinesin-like protein KIF2C [Pimephales promelas]
MDQALEKLLIGLAVNISRSDGRIHSATVKTVNITKATINVEWAEKGMTKGKEVDLDELKQLNSDLMQHLQPCRQEEPKPTTAPIAAPEKKMAKNIRASELLSRSSRIPTSEPSRRMTTRQTCLFRLPAPPPVVSATAAEVVLAQDLPTSATPKPSGYQKRLVSKVASPLLPTIEAICESEASKCAPMGPPSSRISQMSEMFGGQTRVANKRLSLAKNPEAQKRGKFGDACRPNKQFYQMIEDFRETLEKVPMSFSDPVKPHRICVCVRKRPLNKKELAKKEIDVVTIPGNGALLLHEPKQKVDLTKYLENQNFHFDYSFDEDATNDLIYRFTAKPLVKTIFEGGMATCFAYGQTGSGKTHTMGGDFTGKSQNSSKGIYALAAQDVFTLLKQKRYADMDLCPYVTFFEIYNGKVFDLLNKKAKLRVLEDEKQQVNVVGLHEVPVSSVDDVIKMIEKGSACRTSGQTFANAISSRSHAILQVILKRRNFLHGKFSLVDLAGNERGNDVSSNDRHTIVETAEINRSLLALKECIRSLGQNSEHIPFRMSKLTQVLRDSFIGENSRTCMIAMISPGMGSCEYTLNTLRYANRVKELNGMSKGASVENFSHLEISEEGNSSEEESVVPAFEAISQVSNMEERFYEELKGCSEIARSMEYPSFDILANLPEIDACMTKLQASYQALRSAIEAEQRIRMSPT